MKKTLMMFVIVVCFGNVVFGQVYHTITAGSLRNGSVDPVSTSILEGTSKMLTAVPNSGYKPLEWFENGEKVQDGGMTYTVMNIQGPVTVEVVFIEIVYFADVNLKAAVEQKLGIVDPSVYEILGLTKLRVRYSTITSLVGLGYATNLTNLDFFHGEIAAVPPEIGNLASLKVLVLAYNRIEVVSPEIGNLSNLSELYLDSNLLTSVPPEIGNLVNLDRLYLDNNLLTSVPPEIGNLQDLDQFSLNNNLLTSIPPEIGNLSLVTFYLSHNKLSDIEPLTTLSDVSVLEFADNPLNTRAYSTHLNKIWGRNPAVHRVYDPDPCPVVDWNLQQAFEDALGFGHAPTVDEMNTLTSLDASGCGVVSVAGLEYAENLEVLDLSGNSFVLLASEVDSLANLDSLNLSNNSLASLPTEVGNLTNLTSLDLSSNSFDSLPLGVCNIAGLGDLSLSDNNLTTLPPEIGNLTNLTRLVSSDNRLTSVPPETGNLIFMTYLDLSDNSLTSLPSEIGSLIELTYLDLSDNSLSSVPAEIGSFINLTYLDLSDNDLDSLSYDIDNINKSNLLFDGPAASGSSEIGNLINLAWLDLSFNQISDIGSLVNLTNLTWLDLVDNSLNTRAYSTHLDQIQASSPLPDGLTYDPDPCPIEDWNLQQAFEDALGFGHAPTVEEMLTLTVVDANDMEITSVVGLEYAENLESLDLSGNSISIIGEIGELDNLTMVDLSDNPLGVVAYTEVLPEISESQLLLEVHYDENLNPLSIDNCFDFDELVVFMSRWLADDSDSDNDWGGGSDVDHDGFVDMRDFAQLVSVWLGGSSE